MMQLGGKLSKGQEHLHLRDANIHRQFHSFWCLFVLLYSFGLFFKTGFLCVTGCPGTHSVTQAGIKCMCLHHPALPFF